MYTFIIFYEQWRIAFVFHTLKRIIHYPFKWIQLNTNVKIG